MSKEPKTKKTKYKVSIGDRIISILTYVIYSIFAFVCVYPFYYIFINTISANDLSERGKIIFWPKGIHFTNYLNVMKIDGLLQATKISLARTVIGTFVTVIVAAFLGYMFTRETMWHRKLWFRMVAATMYFNAGIIPWFITMKNMKLNFVWRLISSNTSCFAIVPSLM